MIEAVLRKVQASPYRERSNCARTRLSTVDDATVDVVLCVGSFEHMLEREQAVRQVARVLEVGGLLVLLMPNGRYCWYRFLVPLAGIATRHLSTDRFLDGQECARMFQTVGLRPSACEFWTFIPKGDMPRWCGALLHGLDHVGRVCRVGIFRGGLILTGVKDS
jgi:2-polyprenyl-6-hydroxyphenyl methylase/3-demethylubiquinone-9 3-methyltransferase